MFKYERNLIKRGYGLIRQGILGVAAQVSDPAVRRAVVLGLSAYAIRHVPFLDQGAAEGLSDKVLVVTGLVLSKLPGTLELKARAAAPPAAPVIPPAAPAPEAAPAIAEPVTA